MAEDYYAAMAQIEKQLDPGTERDRASGTNEAGRTGDPSERAQLLALLDRLAEPQISVETRQGLVEKVRHLVVQ